MTSDPSPKGPPKAVRLGKYEIIEHLARGGVGSVYRAREVATGREYAIKVLTKEMAAKPAMVERFRREARHAAKLQHENIVRVYEFDEHKGTYYIVMEFVDGLDLADYIEQQGTLDPEETRDIMIQACRALQHAHEQGIVHRDVKPSNFMLTKQQGRQVVKLLDLGLARTTSDDEGRVTRVGTTVGTVDYISPEQARASSSADIRSDLYSLGCTWYHMLAGQPPFGAGGLAERILKHLEETPPDVRQFNPRASKALVKVLNKLLKKDPRERYQTPAEALQDLTQLLAVAKTTKDSPRSQRGSSASDSQLVAAATKRGPPRRKGKKTRPSNGDTVAEKRDTVETSLPGRWLWIGAATLLSAVLLGTVALAVAWKMLHPRPADNPPALADAKDQHVLVTRPNLGPKPSPHPESKPDPVVKVALPSLVPPNAPPIDVAKLRKRLDAAFPKVELAHTEPLRIQRTLGGETTAFATLADALATAPLTQPVTVEIQDNGPLFWPITAVGGRNVTVRAAKGYRPLLVWEVEKTMPGRPAVFLSVADGRLHLEGVDVVAQWPDKLKQPLTLVQAVNSDFSARNCTFSLSGRHENPVTVVRFLTTKIEPCRCRFTNCVLRGTSLQALDLEAPGGLVLFENCLVAGGAFPLLQVRSGERPATVFVVRSTLVGAATLLRLQGADSKPSLNWLSWDSLLSRSNDQAGGELLALPPGGTAAKIKWESLSTLYAGWQTLLSGVEPIRYDRASAWRVTMRLPSLSSDRAVGEIWPAPQADLAEVSAAVFKASAPSVAFGASVNNVEPIGCVPNRLPPLRNNWKALVYERVMVPPFDVLENDAPVSGQMVDLSTQDLGLFLQKMQATRGFGSKVVLRLKGTGMRPMTPVKLKGVQLTLYFEQPADDAQRLILTPAPGGAESAALLEIEGGGLEISNGAFAFPDGEGKTRLSSLFKVSGGTLRLYRCRLFGPHRNAGPDYRALIQFEGSGDAAVLKGHSCVVNESVLVTDKTAVLLHGVGARLLVKQSVLLTGGPALRIDPGPGFQGRANVQCVLTSSSVASRQAILQVDDAAAPEPTLDPIVIQSMQCAFLAPFKDSKSASVVRFGGNAVAHGLFVWQTDSDLFDARFPFGCLPSNVAPTTTSLAWPAACRSLGGPYAATHMKTDAVLTRQIEPTKSWALEQLLLTPPKVWPSDSKPPAHGADLLGKGFVKKAKG